MTDAPAPDAEPGTPGAVSPPGGAPGGSTGAAGRFTGGGTRARIGARGVAAVAAFRRARTARRVRSDSPGAAATVTTGACAGLAAAALGLGACAVPIVLSALASAAGGGHAHLPGVLRAAVQIWLAAHRTGLYLATQNGGAVRMEPAPLGLTVPIALLLVRAGRVCARRSPGPGGCAGRLVVSVLAYTLFAAAAAGVASTDSVRPVAVNVPVHTALLVLLAAGIGAVAAGGFRGRSTARPVEGGGSDVRPWSRPGAASVPTVVRSAAAGLCVLAGAGAALVSLSLAVHAGRTLQMMRAVAPDVSDAFGLFLLCATLLPDAVVWAVAYASGPGFAVGVGSSVAPTGVTLGQLPALPLLGALPSNGGPGPEAWCAVVVPLLAGAAVGVFAERGHRRAGGLRTRAVPAVCTAVAAAATAGVAAAAAAWLSSGSAGGRALLRVGPSPWLLGGAVAGELALLGGTTALALCWWHGRGDHGDVDTVPSVDLATLPPLPPMPPLAH